MENYGQIVIEIGKYKSYQTHTRIMHNVLKL